LVVGYLGLIEAGKRLFYGAAAVPPGKRAVRPHRHIRRRAAYFSTARR
jgi:P-type Mg2+ transporter